MQEVKFVFFLALFSLIALLGFLVFGPHVHELWTGLSTVATDIWNAAHILFFVFLGLLVAGAGVHVHKAITEVRPGKHGPVQAVKYKGQLVALNTADPVQMAKLMQAMTQYSKAQPRITEEVESAPSTKALAAPIDKLPTLVRYEDVKPQIPDNHALVGIDERGIVTRDRAIKALIWIVGGSGTGKTTSVCLRVDEDYQWGHKFLVIDPHWFKEDSLFNAIKGYADSFLLPVAYETEDIVKVLDTFLAEFKRRKSGGSWTFPITILIDEVGSLTSDKPETDIEQEMINKIKQVARICGQESRGFEMCGMFISQDAAGLAWLRKRAIMVLAHQLLMMSERMLACNENAEIARDMDDWPIGRTLVYGIGFKEGQRVVQQPMFQPRIVESTIASPLRTQQLFVQSDMQSDVQSLSSSTGNTGPLGGKPLEGTDCTFSGDTDKLKKVRQMLRKKCTQQDIVCDVWDVKPSTRAFHAAVEEYRDILAFLIESSSALEGDR